MQMKTFDNHTLSLLGMGNMRLPTVGDQPGAPIDRAKAQAMIDYAIAGSNRRIVMTIISAKAEEINEFINIEMNRGTTIYRAHGGYSTVERAVITTVVHRQEYIRIKEKIEHFNYYSSRKQIQNTHTTNAPVLNGEQQLTSFILEEVKQTFKSLEDSTKVKTK